MRGAAPPASEALEIDLLLEALFQSFGFDFRSYERTALTRKLHDTMELRGLRTVSNLQDRVLHESAARNALLRALSVQAVGLFDDPEMARRLRIVLGMCLRGCALPRIWLAECAGVEEAWSMAILLAEQQLHARTEIFATMANEELLLEASEGCIPLERLAECQDHYLRGGGVGQVADYFQVSGQRAVLLAHLKSRITWAQYNLVTDASFNEFELIVCRRALTDFGPVLRQRVLRLFHDSLARFGMIGIDHPIKVGDPLASNYMPVFPDQPWYKRVA